MKSVNIAELKNRLSAYLADVRAGHEILVRDRHTVIARILPVSRSMEEDEELHALAAQGKVRLGERPLGADFWKLPAPRVPSDVLRRALERERDDGRA